MKKIKAGTHLYLSHTSAHIGSLTRGVRITDPELITQARTLLTGEVADPLIDELSFAGLLDTDESSIKLTKRSSESISERDASYQQLRNRMAPELSQLTLHGNVDGGVDELSARQNFAIELSGNSRVVALLYTLLLASGATNTRISPTVRSAQPLIKDSDIATPCISANEIGINYRSHLEELRSRLTLLPIDKSCKYSEPFLRADVKIHCGPIDPEIHALWMSSNQPHLIIGEAKSGEVIIGPLVEPGVGPCNRCLSLLERDNYGFSHDQAIALSQTSDFPMIVSYYIASLVADFVLRYCRDVHKKEKSELVGKVINLTYQSPLASTLSSSMHLIARHPLCGCAFMKLS